MGSPPSAARCPFFLSIIAKRRIVPAACTTSDLATDCFCAVHREDLDVLHVFLCAIAASIVAPDRVPEVTITADKFRFEFRAATR